jgi:fluoride exporter
MNFLYVVIGGSIGSLTRWGLGLLLNPLFPTIPMGTLIANLAGGYLIGNMIGLMQVFPTLPEAVRLLIITGFLGGLTTFCTFSAETVYLFLERNYLYTLISILSHVGGTILMTILGIFTIKIIF